jgi:hypothetical protein
MKYQVGDLVLIKDCRYKSHSGRRAKYPRPKVQHLNLNPYLECHRYLFNSFGIITKAENHIDTFGKSSSEKNNGYCWFSQLDAKEYFFYEDEVTGEIVK